MPPRPTFLPLAHFTGDQPNQPLRWAGPPDPATSIHPATYLRVFLTLTHPHWRRDPIAKRARRCKLSVAQYHRLSHSPEIRSALSTHLAGSVTQFLPTLVEETILNSQLPGKDGANDRRILWNASGLLSTRNVKHGGDTLHVDFGPELAQALSRERGPVIEGVYQEHAAPVSLPRDAAADLPAGEPSEPEKDLAAPSDIGDFLTSL
jgi:hypothetical protein